MSAVNLDAFYQNFMLQLKSGQRPSVELSKTQVRSLCRQWEEEVPDGLNCEYLRPWLALLGHCRKGYFEFQKIVIGILHTVQDAELVLFALAAFEKHIVGFYQRKGERIPGQIVEELKIPLGHPHPQVVLWTLGTIEQLGPQRAILRSALLERMPGIWKMVWPTERAIRQKLKALLARKMA